MAIGVLAIAAVPFFVDLPERLHRRIYWFGFLVGTILMSIAVSPRGWHASLAICIAGAMIAAGFAFFYDDSLLKIGNRYFSYTMRPPGQQSPSSDGEEPYQPPPDSYLGVVSARNHWWLVAVSACVIGTGPYIVGWTWKISMLVGAAIVGAALSGWDDAGRRLPIARGQRVQFAIASLASLMVFALPLIAYLGAYFAASRWSPARRDRALGRDLGETPEPE
ncbi:hypothetical protein [Mycobacterium spongiae]|uniref:Uncharacterized protein n=1 Tax=Mycobacterium spongiae TaxID=886343 RepID=A0A975K1R3_9MYCO|nr:hypothetical protein [Mycobacterium spongiae]QUR69468.1 hypothetical protein F6B93_22445 [Mycobacterium spongiae]